MSFRVLSLALASILLAAPPLRAADAAQEKIRAAVAKVFDTSVLHHIEIVIPERDVAKIQRRTDERISCTFTFDGVTLTNVGVRQAGGFAHPYLPIERKPSLS